MARSTRLSLRIYDRGLINLADDDELLAMLNAANFVGIFVGIESSDTATLVAMRKKQNTRRSIAQSIHKIYAAGLFVTADSSLASIARHIRWQMA